MSDAPIFVINQKVIDSGSMAGDLVSSVLDLGELTGYAVQFIWSGSPVGFVTTSGSNTMTVADFVPVDTHATGGSAGVHLLNVEKVHYRYVLVQFTRTSGSGTLDCYVSGKRA